MHDLVIRNATIVDGTGAAARPGDVAVDGERIVAVGDVDGRTRREVDADGRVVTPGFVDIHTHYDGQATWDPEVTPSSWHGVTTIVMGNCGVGFAPADPSKRDWLIQLMEGVEDIPGTALAEGMTWDWETFPEYLDELDRLPRVLDVAALVPHGAVRAYVMGERGAHNEAATAEEIDEMRAVVADAIRAGAVGFSTTRTILHRAKDGELAAGTTATADELIGIGAALGEAGGGVFELASDMVDPAEEFAWMSAIAAQTGRPVTFNCLQDDVRPDHWRELIELAEKARADGAQVVPQVAGRPACLLLGWHTSANPFMFAPAFQALADATITERTARLRDPQVRATIVEQATQADDFSGFLLSQLHKTFPLGDPPDYEPAPEASIGAIAARDGRPAVEVAYDALLEDDGQALLYLPILGYTHGDFGALHEMLTTSGTVLGLGDGGAHCGLLCDASLPSYMLSHWARDRDRGPRLGLEQAVAMQTSQTAALYGFGDRGVLAPGYLADINVIDFDALSIPAPELVHDLPAGGRRLVQRASGYGCTVKRGAGRAGGRQGHGRAPRRPRTRRPAALTPRSFFGSTAGCTPVHPPKNE